MLFLLNKGVACGLLIPKILCQNMQAVSPQVFSLQNMTLRRLPRTVSQRWLPYIYMCVYSYNSRNYIFIVYALKIFISKSYPLALLSSSKATFTSDLKHSFETWFQLNSSNELSSNLYCTILQIHTRTVQHFYMLCLEFIN